MILFFRKPEMSSIQISQNSLSFLRFEVNANVDEGNDVHRSRK